MRIALRAIIHILVLAGVCLGASPRAFAQSAGDMMPAESAAKAKEILQQAVQGMGGTAYLNVRDVTCNGGSASSAIPASSTALKLLWTTRSRRSRIATKTCPSATSFQ